MGKQTIYGYVTLFNTAVAADVVIGIQPKKKRDRVKADFFLAHYGNRPVT